MKIAIVDIGSNTVKMTIFSREGEILYKKSMPVGLIGYIENHNLSEKGIEILKKTLIQYDTIAKNEGADRIYPFATACLRAAANRDEVMRKIEAETGYKIDLVSGEEEAALSYNGVTRSLNTTEKDIILLDMGGGSCEVISRDLSSAVSLPVGALYLFVRFVKNLLPTKEELAAIYRHTQATAQNAGVTRREGEVVVIGGSVRVFCRFHAHVFGKSFSEDAPYTVTRKEAEVLLDAISEMKNETKLMLIQLLPQRVHTVATGLCAILALLDTLEKDRFTVVPGGAREGYFKKIQNQILTIDKG